MAKFQIERGESDRASLSGGPVASVRSKVRIECSIILKQPNSTYKDF